MAQCEVCNLDQFAPFKLFYRLEKLNANMDHVETLEDFDYIICTNCANNVKLSFEDIEVLSFEDDD